MIKPILTGFIFILFLIQSTGVFAQKYQNGLIDRTVAVIANEMIQLSQIESEVQMMQAQGYTTDKNSRCQVLEQMLESKLFLIQARMDSLNVNPDMVNAQLDERINNVLSQLGGEKAAEEYFGKSMYKLRQEWRGILTEQSLVQDMQRQVATSIVKLTPKQVKDFYKKADKDSLPIISTQYKISQIAKYPKKKDAELEVKEKLLDFRERILAGEKFSMLATFYSQDPGSAMKGGELGMMSKSVFWPAFSDAAMSLKIGQVSPIVETPDGFHILQMVAKDGDMINVRHILLKPEFSTEIMAMASNTLDSIRAAIIGDTISFENAARAYSDDLLSRTNGGIVADPNTGSTLFEKDQLKPQDYEMLKDLEIGDVSVAFESADNEGRSGNLVYKILRLEELIPSHIASFEMDFNVLLEVANNQQAMVAINEFIQEKQVITYIVIDPLFENCNFERKGWIK